MPHCSVLVALMAGTLAFANVARADHAEPAKAKAITFPLVNSYLPCDPGSANTATQTGGMPACTPPDPFNFDGCALSPTGWGKLALKVVGNQADGNQDLQIAVAVTGLNQSCNRLSLLISFRLTTDDCPPASCTAVDVIDQLISGAFCNVTNGKCKIKTTLNTAAPGFMATNAKNAGIQILGCGLGGINIFDRPLSCGLLLK
jgi:hypothetical protein